MQVYRGMDIGTAKLTPPEMAGVPHHLIDVVDPDEPFTVAEWTRRADDVIARLHQNGQLPIVVGGTGLYIRAITEDLDFAGQAGSEAVRSRWQAFADTHGREALYARLADMDPATAQRLHPNDVRRVVRALEVAELGLRPMSAGYDWRTKGGRYDTLQYGLTFARDVLYGRVDARVDQMIRDGLEGEVRRLLGQGYGPSLTSMQAIGYKEMAAYVTGEASVAEAVEQIKRATRRFVKRQLSWFSRDTRISWVQRDEAGDWTPSDGEAILAMAHQMAAGIHVQRIE